MKKIFCLILLTAVSLWQTALAQSMSQIAMDSTLKDHKIIYFGKGEDHAARLFNGTY